MKTNHYKVAGHLFTLHLTGNEEAISLPSYKPFATESTADDTPLFILTQDDDFYPSQKGDTIGEFDCGGADFNVYQLPDGGYQILISPPGGQFCGLLQASADFSTGTIATRGINEDRNFALNNALMLMFAFAAAEKNTVLVHASVIRNANRGYLFLGKSGTGKSTHSSLWLKYIPGSELLNDDNPVVVARKDGATVYGSPWSGKTPCYRNEEAEIGAFVRIRREKRNYIDRDTVMQAFSSLLPSVSTMKWDKRIYTGICDTISLLIGAVPCYTLSCLPDEEAAVVCHREVTAHE